MALAVLALGLSACSPAAVVERSEAESKPPAIGPSPTATPTGASTTAAPSPAPSSSAVPSPTAAAASAAPPPTPTPTIGRFAAAANPASALVVVNKRRPLAPIDFVPELTRPNVPLATSGESTLLNPTTARAAEKMFAAAAAAGAPMTLVSGYRSYATQVATYSGWVAREGQAMADVASARPGYSEHQTGWAFDIGDASGACSLQPCFKDTGAAQWAAAHAWEFGFIVRYPWWFHETTGYYYEPWHLRYIGVEAAAAMHAQGTNTLEDFLGLPPAPTYAG
ncbi:M15 family metallopeptidase [Sinomonas cyclohexanicum]|nr:M15 family metallopeptidase [Corynebacterium cyclohexanicum]